MTNLERLRLGLQNLVAQPNAMPPGRRRTGTGSGYWTASSTPHSSGTATLSRTESVTFHLTNQAPRRFTMAVRVLLKDNEIIIADAIGWHIDEVQTLHIRRGTGQGNSAAFHPRHWVGVSFVERTTPPPSTDSKSEVPLVYQSRRAA
ncbi:hypothetical protein QT969_10510 [Rhodococcus sp. CSLK01-03]|uniref:Uncharacterized protein n=1 Tax=Rhodococcus indonesiensis TaxID=3055869 RepID=A0ABT7RM53_9NOCA|nr:hypothetical protein [Rhodococcus indonesiensis]MDM7488723.1 hypothetical protein [Rhodococcus indonesiensis]